MSLYIIYLKCIPRVSHLFLNPLKPANQQANFTHAKEKVTIDSAARLSYLGPAEAWSVFRNVVSDTIKLCIPLKKAMIKIGQFGFLEKYLGQPGTNVNVGVGIVSVRIGMTLQSARVRKC